MSSTIKCDGFSLASSCFLQIKRKPLNPKVSLWVERDGFYTDVLKSKSASINDRPLQGSEMAMLQATFLQITSEASEWVNTAHFVSCLEYGEQSSYQSAEGPDQNKEIHSRMTAYVLRRAQKIISDSCSSFQSEVAADSAQQPSLPHVHTRTLGGIG